MSFDAWVRRIFDHPVRYPLGDPIEAVEPEPPAAESVRYLTRLFTEPIAILTPYSNAQIAQGIWQFSHTYTTSYLQNLLDARVDWNDRRECIRSIATFFEQIFSRRCSGEMFHLGRGAASPLNAPCFLWWDMFPTWGEPEDESRAAVDAELLEVITRGLSLDSLACQESALHGLGHWQDSYPAYVQRAIDEFLARSTDIPAELREYADDAREGYVE